MFLLERKQGAKVGNREWGVGSGERKDETLWRAFPHAPLPTPHSPPEPGIVIALKISHCIHIAFVSLVTPEAVWMVMI